MVMKTGEMGGERKRAIQKEQYDTRRFLYCMPSFFHYGFHVLNILLAVFIAQARKS